MSAGRVSPPNAPPPGELLLEAVIPGLPPSVNGLWKVRPRGLYKSHAARQWQHDAVWLMKSAAGLPVATFGGPVSYLLLLLASTGRKSDADNRVKAFQDCLQMAGIIADDCQVKDHRVIHAVTGRANQTAVYLWAGERLPEGEMRRLVGELEAARIK